MTFFSSAENEPNEFEYPKPRPVLAILTQRSMPVQYTEGQKKAAEWVESARAPLDQAIALMKQAAAERQNGHPEMADFHARKAKEVLASIKTN